MIRITAILQGYRLNLLFTLLFEAIISKYGLTLSFKCMENFNFWGYNLQTRFNANAQGCGLKINYEDVV